MTLCFINCFSIKLSSVSLKRSLQISLHKVFFTSLETSFLPNFLLLRFNVLTGAIISVSSAFPLIKSEFRQSFVDEVALKYYYLLMYQYVKSDIDFQKKKICGRFPNFANLKLITKWWYKWKFSVTFDIP